MPVTEAVKALFYAPFVCCSHDETDTFNYANQAALNLWEFEWDDFIGMPARRARIPKMKRYKRKEDSC